MFSLVPTTKKQLKRALFTFDLGMLLSDWTLFTSGFQVIMKQIYFGSQKNQIE